MSSCLFSCSCIIGLMRALAIKGRNCLPDSNRRHGMCCIWMDMLIHIMNLTPYRDGPHKKIFNFYYTGNGRNMASYVEYTRWELPTLWRNMSILSTLLNFTENHVIVVPRLPGRGVMLLRTVGNLSRPFQHKQSTSAIPGFAISISKICFTCMITIWMHYRSAIFDASFAAKTRVSSSLIYNLFTYTREKLKAILWCSQNWIC
jgi:hypothetical protein